LKIKKIMIMQVNSTDIQFLTGCSRKEAESIILRALEITPAQIKKGFRVKPSTYIEVDAIKKKLLSVNECMDGKNPVQNAVDLIKEHGISDTMKRTVLNDVKCWHNRDLTSTYKVLRKILPKSEIEELKRSLKRRCYQFLLSGGKFPKSFKPISLEVVESEYREVLESSNS